MFTYVYKALGFKVGCASQMTAGLGGRRNEHGGYKGMAA